MSWLRVRTWEMPKTIKGAEPAEVYIPFVQSLFRDGTTLAIGVFLQTITIFLVYLENRSPYYLLTAIVVVATGLIRVIAVQSQQYLPVLVFH